MFDEKEFEEVTKKYYDYVYGIAIGVLGNKQDAEDAANAVLMKMYNHYKQEGQIDFLPNRYFYRTTYNHCINMIGAIPFKQQRANISLDTAENGDKILNSLIDQNEDVLTKLISHFVGTYKTRAIDKVKQRYEEEYGNDY
ncbi:RNA polymerase sigma factor [Candidatus Latescibacterota bacterium]